ncbi:hypothetical protein FRC19_005574 [Serendipita sp. 401]|nr:hypothetical protein FRC15_001099 [Serendipita sp. 397]KAG8808943.1 hypothetical protein FRC19_005574 [Serendipita sp. 401]
MNWGWILKPVLSTEESPGAPRYFQLFDRWNPALNFVRSKIVQVEMHKNLPGASFTLFPFRFSFGPTEIGQQRPVQPIDNDDERRGDENTTVEELAENSDHEHNNQSGVPVPKYLVYHRRYDHSLGLRLSVHITG